MTQVSPRAQTSTSAKLHTVLGPLNGSIHSLPAPPVARDGAVRREDLGIGFLFERIRDAVIVGDTTTGRIVLWNPAAEALFGYSVSEDVSVVQVPELLTEVNGSRSAAPI
jgi:PAS domain-containing protein